MGLITNPPCWTTCDSIILSLSIEVSPTMVFPLTSLMTLVAGGSSAEPAAEGVVAIISILLLSVRNPFLGRVVPLISSFPVAELINPAGIVVPLVVVPMICNPVAVLLVRPLGVLIADDEWRPFETLEVTFKFRGNV